MKKILCVVVILMLALMCIWISQANANELLGHCERAGCGCQDFQPAWGGDYQVCKCGHRDIEHKPRF